jgi:NhaP-type Na+/H+ or K+/H+ antiporter
MSSTDHHESAAEAAVWVSGVGTLIGILLFVFFPLAIPILVLTIVFVAPLGLALIPLALPLRAIRRRPRRRAARSPSGSRPVHV